MSWSHKDSWEVSLVLEVLKTLQRDLEPVNFETGEVSHGVSFTRERSIPHFHRASGRRFDFSVLVDNGKRKREFLIEVHGKQHYEFRFLGNRVGESDRLKKEWAENVQDSSLGSFALRSARSALQRIRIRRTHSPNNQVLGYRVNTEAHLRFALLKV